MATESIGDTLKICYSESVYEYIIEKVEEQLKANTDLRTRIEAIV